MYTSNIYTMYDIYVYISYIRKKYTHICHTCKIYIYILHEFQKWYQVTTRQIK